MKDQRTSFDTEDKHSSVQQICVLTSIAFLVRKIGHMCLAVVARSYGWQADEIQVEFET